MKRFVALALACSLLSFTGCGEKKETTSHTVSKKENGYRAYDFSFVDINGNKHKLSDFKGKVVIVQFFGTYCPPCREEIPVLEGLYKKYGGRLVVIGLAVDDVGDTPENQRQFVEKALKPFVSRMGMTYYVAPAPQKAWEEYAYKIIGLDSIPQTYIIDKQGFLRYYETGFTPSYASLFDEAVRKLLAEK